MDRHMHRAGHVKREIGDDPFEAVFRNVGDAIARAQAAGGTALIDFRVEQEDSVYPMVPAGADLQAMIRRPHPSAIAGTAADLV